MVALDREKGDENVGNPLDDDRLIKLPSVSETLTVWDGVCGLLTVLASCGLNISWDSL